MIKCFVMSKVHNIISPPFLGAATGSCTCGSSWLVGVSTSWASSPDPSTPSRRWSTTTQSTGCPSRGRSTPVWGRRYASSSSRARGRDDDRLRACACASRRDLRREHRQYQHHLADRSAATPLSPLLFDFCSRTRGEAEEWLKGRRECQNWWLRAKWSPNVDKLQSPRARSCTAGLFPFVALYSWVPEIILW